MTPLRERCEYSARCGQTGHYFDNGQAIRCDCLNLEMNKRRLGPMFTEKVKEKTSLSQMESSDAVLTGTLEGIRSHAGRVLLDRADRHGQWITIDAYRLIDIFLKQDTEFETQAAIADTELLIILLGFGDPRNRYLPELICQVLARRELIRMPTWVVMGIPLEIVPTKYNTEVFERLSRMKRVSVK